MSVSVICAIIGCLVGSIIALFTTIYSMCKEIDKLENDKSFYEDLYNQYKEDCQDYKIKIDEYDKIFENIKSQIPF